MARGAGVRITNWRGRELTQQLRKEIEGRLAEAGEVVASKVRRNISTSSRSQGRSNPAGMPHADTGRLRNSVTYEVDKQALTVKIGTNVEYAPFLELGTLHMDERPFLIPTAEDMRDDVRDIFKRPFKFK